MASHSPFREAKNNEIKEDCEYYNKKGKHFGQVPRCNF